MTTSTINSIHPVATVPFLQYEVDVKPGAIGDVNTLTLRDEYGETLRFSGEPIVFTMGTVVESDGATLDIVKGAVDGTAGTIVFTLVSGCDAGGGALSVSAGKFRVFIWIPAQGRFPAAHVAGIAGVTDIV